MWRTLNYFPRQTRPWPECYQVRRKSETRILRTPLSYYYSDKSDLNSLTLYRSQIMVPRLPRAVAPGRAHTHAVTPEMTEKCTPGGRLESMGPGKMLTGASELRRKRSKFEEGWDFPVAQRIKITTCQRRRQVRFPVWEDSLMLQSKQAPRATANWARAQRWSCNSQAWVLQLLKKRSLAS